MIDVASYDYHEKLFKTSAKLALASVIIELSPGKVSLVGNFVYLTSGWCLARRCPL